MSYRSTLLATTLCLALTSAAAIDPASAHGGGGGGSVHTSGPSSIAHAPAFAPVHLGTPAGSVSKVLSQPGKFSVPLSSKVTLRLSALKTGMPMEIPGPAPAPLPAPTETPKHPMKGLGGISVSVIGDAGPIADGDCYRVKRRLSTPDGYVIRYVKVCEVLDADQLQ